MGQDMHLSHKYLKEINEVHIFIMHSYMRQLFAKFTFKKYGFTNVPKE